MSTWKYLVSSWKCLVSSWKSLVSSWKCLVSTSKALSFFFLGGTQPDLPTYLRSKIFSFFFLGGEKKNKAQILVLVFFFVLVFFPEKDDSDLPPNIFQRKVVFFFSWFLSRKKTRSTYLFFRNHQKMMCHPGKKNWVPLPLPYLLCPSASRWLCLLDVHLILNYWWAF